MKLATISDIDKMKELVVNEDPDLVIVEGFDGVGKGRIVKELVRTLGIKVYRPDYEYWNKHLDTKQRWIISRAFFDLISLVGIKDKLLLDRSMVSGAVYANDRSVIHDMKNALRGSPVRILHILVTTDKDSYYKMQGVRLGEEMPRTPWAMCRTYTDRFQRFMNEEDIDYIEFKNTFDNKVGNKGMGVCGGCDNWNALRQDFDTEKLIGRCSHWGSEMSEDAPRCPYYEKGDVHAR